MARPAAVRIGVSGWTYAPWRGHFYPPGLPQRCELAHAARTFRSLEINGTFYGLQKPDVFARWAEETPDDFVFAVKGSRYVTHMLRLKEVATPLANFIASGILRLGPKLGPILWQLPPSMPFDIERLDAFLSLLPHTTAAAAALAERHDDRLAGRAWTRTDADRSLRHALEIRHASFRDPAFIALLRRRRVALVCADTVEWPRLMDLTADFVYCRLHGDRELYRSRYSTKALDAWAARIAAWSTGRGMKDGEFAGRGRGAARRREVFVYFDNTDKRHAPADAKRLEARVEKAEGRQAERAHARSARSQVSAGSRRSG
ncbi:MAG: DUF72 domain-containing protein [Alphaproteobacteria bacterium]